MKRYIVFAHVKYYPNGGWGDSCGMFDNIEDAKRCDVTTWFGGMPDHAYIVDLEAENVIMRYNAGFWIDVRQVAP